MDEKLSFQMGGYNENGELKMAKSKYKDFTLKTGKTPGGRDYRTKIDHDTGDKITNVFDGNKIYYKKTSHDYSTGRQKKEKSVGKRARIESDSGTHIEKKGILKGPTKPMRKKNYSDPVAKLSRKRAKS